MTTHAGPLLYLKMCDWLCHHLKADIFLLDLLFYNHSVQNFFYIAVHLIAYQSVLCLKDYSNIRATHVSKFMYVLCYEGQQL